MGPDTLGVARLDGRGQPLAASHELGLVLIEQAMVRAGLAHRDLASKVGLSVSGVWRILEGKRRLTVKFLSQALEACGHDLALTSISKVDPPNSPSAAAP